MIPNLDVILPGDPEETAGAFVAALERTDGPTLLALSRQAVPLLSEIPLATRREGACLHLASAAGRIADPRQWGAVIPVGLLLATVVAATSCNLLATWSP